MKGSRDFETGIDFRLNLHYSWDKKGIVLQCTVELYIPLPKDQIKAEIFVTHIHSYVDIPATIRYKLFCRYKDGIPQMTPIDSSPILAWNIQQAKPPPQKLMTRFIDTKCTLKPQKCYAQCRQCPLHCQPYGQRLWTICTWTMFEMHKAVLLIFD